MRRKLNPQTSGYVQNNDLICFGLSEHTLEERQPIWTPQAKKDLAILASWFPKRNMDEVVRPAYRSEYNFNAHVTRQNLAVLLAGLFMRELPIKSFYTRTAIAYCWISWFILRGIGRGLNSGYPVMLYNNDYHLKPLLNHPDLFWWFLTRPLQKNPPVPDNHLEWRFP